MTPMKEKQIEMNDNDIIKALECCFVNVNCKGCPMQNPPMERCLSRVCSQALLLINRQKAEIERLEKENNQFADIGKIKTEVVKKFLEGTKEVMLSTGMGKYSMSVNEVIDSLLEGVEEAVGEGK
jgi:hypothetical protein